MKEKNILTDFGEIERVKLNPTEVTEEQSIFDDFVWDELTPRQLKFIELYCSDFLGNWVQAYLEVYDIDKTKPWWYKTACASASRLLSNAKVYKKINQMLEEAWLNDNFVDKQMLFLISQHSDLWVKARMIEAYNKLKQRFVEKSEEKKEITIKIVE